MSLSECHSIWIAIFEFLDPMGLMRASATCRVWHDECLKKRYWKRHCKRVQNGLRWHQALHSIALVPKNWDSYGKMMHMWQMRDDNWWKMIVASCIHFAPGIGVEELIVHSPAKRIHNNWYECAEIRVFTVFGPEEACRATLLVLYNGMYIKVMTFRNEFLYGPTEAPLANIAARVADILHGCGRSTPPCWAFAFK